MRRSGLRDLVLMLAVLAGFHALCVWAPSRLVRAEPSPRILPITAPDCAALLRGAARPASGWFGRGTGGEIPAAPVRP